MDKICLVFDIDDTLLHYGPDHYLPHKFDYEENIFEEKDRMVIRPGLKKFVDFVKTKGDKIILGIWTYGTKDLINDITILNRYFNLYIRERTCHLECWIKSLILLLTNIMI